MHVRRPKVRLRHHADLVAGTDGDVLVSASVGALGEAVCLWISEEGAAGLRAFQASPEWNDDHQSVTTGFPTDLQLTVQHSASISTVTIADFDLACPTAQALPNGRFLVVGAWSDDGASANALVLDESGRMVQRASLGDGIAHVLVSPVGKIWVGYIDEGIFGGGDESIARSGLVRFDGGLLPEWEFQTPSGFDPIYDCYALALNGEEAWAYYYDDFPVVRIGDEVLEGWTNDVAFARAIVTDGSTVALVGGYEDNRSRVVAGTLRDGSLRDLSEASLEFPDGRPIGPARLIGRDGELHVFDGPAWYKAGLSELRAGADLS